MRRRRLKIGQQRRHQRPRSARTTIRAIRFRTGKKRLRRRSAPRLWKRRDQRRYLLRRLPRRFPLNLNPLQHLKRYCKTRRKFFVKLPKIGTSKKRPKKPRK
uniref:(northern house mosquito) hypothetical protein n=1 Tax=Culex pipiens TaxID=7175 RepID=A0A8D8CQM2_CULPI